MDDTPALPGRPPPSNLKWENLGVTSPQQWKRALLTGAMTSGLLFLSLVFISMFSNLQSDIRQVSGSSS